jgi:hypothetical protein
MSNTRNSPVQQQACIVLEADEGQPLQQVRTIVAQPFTPARLSVIARHQEANLLL